jgi:F-type H+-transporting ATPase subunit b
MEMITPNVTQVLTTVVGFLLLVWVLKKYAWGPILDQLDRRRDKIQSDYTAAEQQLGEAQHLKGEFAAKLGEIKTLERERIQEAVKKGEELATGIVADARRHAEETKAKGRQDLDLEAQKAQLELRGTVVDLAVGAAEKLIGERLDDAKHRALIEQYIEQMEGLERA